MTMSPSARTPAESEQAERKTAREPEAEIFCVADTPEDAAPRPAENGVTNQRRAERQRVLKMAHLVYGVPAIPIECLVIDESRLGVMLETLELADVPERVKVRFVGGPTFAALRRWAIGNRIGLEFAGLFPEDEATRRQVRAIKQVLNDIGVHAAVQMLREFDFFENSELQTAAEEAEIAIARLESALN
jgi:hypothetical protein